MKVSITSNITEIINVKLKNVKLKIYVLLRLRVQNRRKNRISHLISELLHTLDSFLRDRLFDVTECRTVAYPGDFQTP